MKNNRLAVFTASLQCTDEVKVMSTEPQVSDDGDLWNLIVGVYHGERRNGMEVSNCEATALVEVDW